MLKNRNQFNAWREKWNDVYSLKTYIISLHFILNKCNQSVNNKKHKKYTNTQLHYFK